MFGCASLGGILYLLGDAANNIIWSKSTGETKAAETSKKTGKARKMRID
jgi:hypothetical protein